MTTVGSADESVIHLMGERARRVLGAMLYTVLAVLPVLLVTMAFGHATRWEILIVAMTLAATGGLTWLFRRGQVDAAVVGLIGVLVACGAFAGVGFGSLRGVGVMALVGAIVVGGIFLGRRALVATVCASAVVLAALAWAQQAQWLRAPEYEVTFDVWLQYVLALVALALNIWFARAILVDAVRAARDGEARLAAIVRSMPSALIISSLEGGEIQDINPAYEKVFGIARSEAVGKTTMALGIWSTTQRAELVAALRRDARVSDWPVRLRRRNGEEFDALLSAEMLTRVGQSWVVASISDVSAHAQARRALEASEARFQSLFRSNPVAMVVQERDTRRLLLANAAAERMFRVTAAAVMGTVPNDRFWVDRQAQETLWNVVERDGRSDPVRATLRRADGEVFEGLVSVETASVGGSRHAAIAIVDLSDELRLRAAQRESDERFVKAFRSSPIAMSITRARDDVFIEVNDAVQVHFGYTREEMIGRTALELGLWADLADRQRYRGALATQGSVAGQEVHLRHKNGEVAVALMYLEPIEVAGEACQLASLVNVTRERRQETQLAEAARGVSAATGEDFFRKLVEHLSRATQAERANIGEIIDGGTRIRTVARYVNGRSAGPIEYELANSPCEQVLHAGELKSWHQGVCDAFPRDEPLVEARMQAYIGAPLFGVDGRPVGILNVLSTRPLLTSDAPEDVFRIFAARAQAELARLQREREILALNDSLEERVRLRTAQVEAANRDLEAFSYSVSHDLRAPLRGIDGFAQLVEERHGAALPSEARGYLQRVRAGTQRMGRIIDDLLALSRVSRGDLKPAPLNLSALARAVAADLDRAHPERRVRWQIDERLEAWGDPGLMHIVLTNLLGNAFKYTGKTDAAWIRFEQVADGAEGIEFAISDNGAGFDMAYAEQLFQPFRRLHGQHEFEGTGVGLATVQRVLVRHGGEVRGEGRVGVGATFRFRLPRTMNGKR